MSTRPLLAFSAIYLVWGSTYLAVAIGLRSFPPMILMGTRCVIGGLILLGWSLLHNQRLPSAQLLVHGIACGLLFSSVATAFWQSRNSMCRQESPPSFWRPFRSGLPCCAFCFRESVVLCRPPFVHWVQVLPASPSSRGQHPRRARTEWSCPGLPRCSAQAFRGHSERS
uniref:EamA family transporter n=1 Tax=Paraburkholderia xenovorans TaxID=36873 RepID=UPI0038BC782E